ncbi:MAG: glycosyltransferase family 39 protein [Bacteroidales bacterium]|nr:glycosyltransferase family 39 protein [Candidatus Latescibacterota bacterium]
MREGKTGGSILGFLNRCSGRIKEWAQGDWDILLVILLLGTAVRVYLALSGQVQQGVSETWTISGLSSITPKGALDTLTPPLYPVIVHISKILAGRSHPIGLFLIQAVLSSISIALVYDAGRKMFCRRTGLVAAAVIAIYPNLILSSLRIRPDSVLVFLILLIMALSVSRIRENIKACGLAVIMGLSIMLTPIAIFIVPGVVFSTRRRILFLIVLAVTLAPWAVRNSTRINRMVPVYDRAAYSVSFDKYSLGTAGPNRDRWKPLHRIYIEIETLFGRSWNELTNEEPQNQGLRNSNYMMTWSYILVLFLGLAGMIRHFGRRHLAAGLPVIGYIVLLIFITDFQMGDRILLEPLLIIFLAALFAYRLPGDGKDSEAGSGKEQKPEKAPGPKKEPGPAQDRP